MYGELYKHVRKSKPREILECGTGISTVIIAQALMENEREGCSKGRITSMEEVEKYYEMAKLFMPEKFAGYVDFVNSPRMEDCYSLFRGGVRYRDIPDRPYDFVFVDGPSYKAPSDEQVTFNFDYIHVVRKSETPVWALTDKRVASCYVFQKIFGLEKAKYNAVTRVGVVGPCTKRDLKGFNIGESSAAFAKRYIFSELCIFVVAIAIVVVIELIRSPIAIAITIAASLIAIHTLLNIYAKSCRLVGNSKLDLEF